MPSILELHTSEEHIEKWIKYSTLDAEATFYLREVLVKEMNKYPVNFEGMKNIFQLYCKYWLPFGEILTNLERRGIKVNLQHLKNAELQARKDLEDLERGFIEWVRKIQPDAYEFNPSSSQQLQHLLFAPFKRNNSIDKKRGKKEDLNPLDFAGNEEEDNSQSGSDDDELTGPKKSARNIDVMNDFPLEREFKVENIRV